MTEPAAGEPAIALDRDLSVIAIDLRFAELLGRSVAALHGQRLAALLHPDDGQRAPAVLRGRPSVPACTRWRWQTATGERSVVVWWRVARDGWTGTLGGTGKILTMLGADAPTVSRSERGERLARLGTFEHDIATGSTTWSRLMYELHEVEPSEVPPASIGEYLRLLHPDDALGWGRALGHALTTGEVVSLITRVRRRTGGLRSLKVTMCCDLRADGSPALVAGTMQDVTDDLETRSQLVRDRERALADTQAKSDFLARVTHELRSPVAGVIGMIDLAVDEVDPAARTAHLSSARASARHLLELIDDLLDASRDDAWRFNVVAIGFSLDQVMAEALAMIAPRAQRKGITLTGEVAAGVAVERKGDPLRLRQILVNLLHNAVKFTEHGGVRARFAAVGPDQLELTVEDSGIGIAPELQATVFDPYVHSGGGEGRGLGLTITRELVATLGGQISLTSSPGAGTCFTVVLPLPACPLERGASGARSASAFAAGSKPRTSPVRALRVLLVEDHAVNAAYLRAILERAGHTLEVVGTGRAGVEAAARRACDVALLDLELPDTDGATVARMIRTAEHRVEARRLPLLGVSAHRDRALTAARAGMDGYLTKPVDAAGLAAALERLTVDGGRPPVDHAIRLARVGGRRELAATIAQTFLGHASQLLEPVDSALGAGSHEGVQRAAHGLRAALLMVGAVPAAELAAQVEQASFEQAQALRPALAFELARATAELEYIA